MDESIKIVPEITNDKNTAANKLKRRNEDNDSIARSKEKRLTNTVNRLGMTEFDDNDDKFFENIRDQQEKEVDGFDAANGNNLLDTSVESMDEKDIGRTVNGGQQSSSENTFKDDELHQQMIFSPGEKILFQKMLDLMAELKVVQKGVMELTAQVSKHATVTENDSEKGLKRLKRDELVDLGLPLKNLTQLKNFDRKLKEDDFYKKTVYSHFLKNIYMYSCKHAIQHIYCFQFDLFTIIGGKDGASDGVKLLKAIFGYLIEPQFLRTISWSGKGDPKTKEKKIRFEKFSEVVSLIHEVCSTADKKYTHFECHKSMVYKIFKTAYRIKCDEDSNDTTRNELQNIGNIENIEVIVINGDDQTNPQFLVAPQEQPATYSANVQHVQALQAAQPVSSMQSGVHQSYTPPSMHPYQTQYRQPTPHESQSNQQFSYYPSAVSYIDANANEWQPAKHHNKLN